MCLTEYDEERTFAEQRAEGRAEGMAEGMAKGRTEGRAEGIAEGMAKGIAKGRTEGRTEGIAEGVAKGKLLLLVGLIEQGFLTLEQAAKELNVTTEEFKKRASKLTA